MPADNLVRVDNFANLEALLNIIANGIEIFGISGGIELFIGGISMLFLQKWSRAGKLAVVGIIIFIVGLAAPGTINWLVASVRDAGLSESNVFVLCIILTIIGLILLLPLMFGIGFLPTIVAFRRNKRNRKLILLLNVLLSLIPFGWNVALFMSFMDDREKSPT